MNNLHKEKASHRPQRRGVVTAEYLLLVTLIGIGVLVGLATLRNAIVAELTDCATAVSKIIVP
jgi:Flp pilus assembly pilin Flp